MTLRRAPLVLAAASAAVLSPDAALSFAPASRTTTPAVFRHAALPGVASSAVRLSAVAGTSAADAVSSAPLTGGEDKWTWRGHEIYSEVTLPVGASASSSNPLASFFGSFGAPASEKKPIALLLHGFGASTTYWRATVSALSENGYEVHAIDLLGQGRSAKPGDVYYSTKLWAALVDDYAREVIGDRDVVLMGNSLGSVVALAATVGETDGGDADAERHLSSGGRVKGVCLFNCGIGMNSKNIIDDPRFDSFQRVLLKATFAVFETLLFNRFVLGYALNNVVTPDLLRDALTGLYKSDPSRVDNELVMSFYGPAKDDGAPEALRQIYTNDPGPTPMSLHEKYPSVLGVSTPIHAVWGDDDAVTSLEEVVGKYYGSLAEDPERRVSLDVVSAGHIPFDDNPEDSNGSMLRWLNAL